MKFLNKKSLLIPILFILSTLTALGVYWVIMKIVTTDDEPAPVASVANEESAQIVDPNETKTLEGRYLFNGTVVIARAVERDAVNSKGQRDYAQPFSMLDTFEREKYDAWSTDFECPITDNVVPYDVQISNLVFNCPPEFLPEMTKYFNIYDLANNHSDNQGGQAGIDSTRNYFDQFGVQYFGNYDPTLTDEICEVVALPIRIKNIEELEQKATLPVAFCGWHFFNYGRGPNPEELEVVRKFADVMPVFGFVEMGNEYQAVASQPQRDIAHQIINAGADFVLGNNPHWVQDTEVYNGKLIVYSLGNFIFDQLDTETQRGVSIDATLTLNYDKNVEKWLAIGESCKAFQDSCLSQARQQGLKRIDFKIIYDAVANQNGARQITRKASSAVQSAVEERMKWAETLSELGQSTQ